MLSDGHIEEYRTQGFTCVPDFLSSELINSFLKKADEIVDANAADDFDPARVEMEPDQSPSGIKIRRIYEPCEHYRIFRNYSESSKLLDAVEKLIGGNIFSC